MGKREEKAIEFISKHLITIAFIAITMMAIAIRMVGIDVISSDMASYLRSWIETIRENGGFASLKMAIGDYGVQYVTLLTILSYIPAEAYLLVKSISLIFDFVGAFAAALLIIQFVEQSRRKIYFVLSYCVFLFLPTVILNSSFWGQCDFMYTSFLLLWLVCFVKEKYTWGIVFFALAFCFKFQTVFFVPALLVFWFVSRKFSALKLLIIPLVYVVTALPAIFAGRPIGEALTVYFKQIDTYKELAMNLGNVYYWFPTDFELLRPIGVLFAFAVIGCGCLLFLWKRKTVEKLDYVWFSLWSAFACVLFLPSMHDRYYFPIEILLFVLAFITRRYWFAATTMIVTTLFVYIPSLFRTELIFDHQYLGIFVFAVFAWLSYDLFFTQLPINTKIDSKQHNTLSH